MCLEVPACWCLLRSTKSCCMCNPLDALRFALILDCLELVLQATWMGLVGFEYLPLLLTINCLSIVIRVAVHSANLALGRLWTHETVKWGRALSLLWQVLAVAVQVAAFWIYIGYDYADLTQSLCRFCAGP